LKYLGYELTHVMINQMRFWSTATRLTLDHPMSPMSLNPFAKSMSAALEVFESLTKRYGKPGFDITTTTVAGRDVAVTEKIQRTLPFCDLVQFARDEATTGKRNDPKVLIVAPMSGHYATLLRGTVKSMLPEHDVYITDWKDARAVPIADGRFDVDDYIDYIIDFVQHLGPNTHVIAVCQPAVPALAATAIMAKRDMPVQPMSLTMMGGPIDTRCNPTAVNDFAMGKPMSWFENNVIATVPFPQAGFMRRVYPGFIQLSGFMAMNFERHKTAYREMFENLVKGDGDSVKQHTDFYDEYLAVMDLPAEFYLQTVRSVFKEHDLPNKRMKYRSEIVDCGAIRKTAIMTIEGERDDICGVGQTEAAHDLCKNVPADEHFHYLQLGVGHYGVFNGSRYRAEIQPRIRDMIKTIEFKRKANHSGVTSTVEVGHIMKPLAIRQTPNTKWDDTQPVGKPN
jgi:poly(3-hydroxybutyrate) depolymerase